MLESMIPKIIEFKDIQWIAPDMFNIKIGEEVIPYKILKGALNILAKELGFKTPVSKDVYKIDKDVWNTLKQIVLDKAADKNNNTKYNFDLKSNNLIYLADNSNNLIDIYKASSEDLVNEYKEILDKFVIDITTTEKYHKFFTDGKGGLVKLVLYSKDINPAEVDYTPIVLLEFNNEKAVYKGYTGILIYNTFTFIPSISSYIDSDSLGEFIYRLNLEEMLKYSIESAQDLYTAYKSFKQNEVEISARELISILKKVGYKLELKTDDNLDSIQNLNDEEGNLKIQNFFNTFTFSTGESAHDILALPELKKIFRYNKLTILDVLTILSKEYLTWDGSKINADILGGIVFNLYDKQNDKKQVELIKLEVE